LQLDVVHFMWHSAPVKKRWCPHHVLSLFFAGLVWNSSMVSWACSMLDSFTQDASIGWYPFHLTKYSHSRPFSYLDLSMALHLKLLFIMNQVRWGPWVVFLIRPWGMSHATYTQGNWVEFQLLVVGSQTANVTPGPSFGHNLCFKSPNGWYKPILDIYILRAF